MAQHRGRIACIDSAAVALASTRVRDAVTAVLTEHQRLGGTAAPTWWQHAGCARISVARLVGGGADQVAFTQTPWSCRLRSSPVVSTPGCSCPDGDASRRCARSLRPMGGP